MDPITLSILGSTLLTVFRPLLGKLATDVLNDKAKDYVGKCVNSVFSRKEETLEKKAAIKTTAIFLSKFESALSYCLDEDETEIQKFLEAAKSIIETDEFPTIINRTLLGAEIPEIQTKLQLAWSNIENPPTLPDDLSWNNVAKAFVEDVRQYRNNDPDILKNTAEKAQIQMSEDFHRKRRIQNNFDPERFRQRIQEKFSYLAINNFDPDAVYYQKIKLWSVFIPQKVRECDEYLPQTFEIPKDQTKQLRECGEHKDPHIDQHEETEEARPKDFDTSPRLVTELLDDTSKENLVILGDPGAGKSSLMRWITLQWAGLAPQELLNKPIPLIIEAKDYHHWECLGRKCFRRYWSEAPGALLHQGEGILDDLLKSGKAVLLLDGLDEIFDPQDRDDTVDAIGRFCSDYPEVQIIVTSRVIGFKGEPFKDSNFRIYMLQDFEDDQINEFLEKWYQLALTNSEDREHKKARLRRSLSEHQRIRDLAITPLLLTMIAILNNTQELPRDRASLYEECSKQLLEKWDTLGIINSNPLFVDSSNGYFSLAPNSPCIDAGNNEVVELVDQDLGGGQRIQNDLVDMGAYEVESGADLVELTIHLEPSEVVDLGSCFRLGNQRIGQKGAWIDSDTTLRVYPGEYDIEFARLGNWIRPVEQSIIVSEAGLTKTFESLHQPDHNLWYVDLDASGADDGSSWSDAFTSIQSAIDAASVEGGEVWVAYGLYYVISDGRPITLAQNVHLYGGFVGSESRRSERSLNVWLIPAQRWCLLLGYIRGPKTGWRF